jgi:ferredoxin
MRVKLDRPACAGHALCNLADDRLFPLDDEGYSALEAHDVAPEDEARTRGGVDSCPERALSLDDG